MRTEEGYEVDFLARYPDRTHQLIQVCADLDSQEAREREVQSLLEAASAYPRGELHIVVLDAETARGLPNEVAVHSAAAWLLAEST